jgi:hypothetical protein
VKYSFNEFRRDLKMLLIATVFFLSNSSCAPLSPYYFKSFKTYPKGLDKKAFIIYNQKIYNTISKDTSWTKFTNVKNWKRSNNESTFFNSTYYQIKNDSLITNSAKILSDLKHASWVWPPIYEEYYGIKGTIWISKKKRDSIKKIQHIHLEKLHKYTKLVLEGKQSKHLYRYYKKLK